MPCSCGATDCDYCGYGQRLHYKRKKKINKIDFNKELCDELNAMKGRLSDLRYSVVVKKTTCKTCGADRWSNWDLYQLRSNLEGAITRIEKSVTIINEVKNDS